MSPRMKALLGAAAPILAVVAIVVALVVMEGKTTGVTVPITTSALPPAPPTVPPRVAGTPSPGSPGRDLRRQGDLDRLSQSLRQYFTRTGSYPSTGGNAQTLCAYESVDAGCKLRDSLGTLPTDPLGNPLNNGYWYVSSGSNFFLIAQWEEGPAPADNVCPAAIISQMKRSDLYCVVSSR